MVSVIQSFKEREISKMNNRIAALSAKLRHFKRLHVSKSKTSSIFQTMIRLQRLIRIEERDKEDFILHCERIQSFVHRDNFLYPQIHWHRSTNTDELSSISTEPM